MTIDKSEFINELQSFDSNFPKEQGFIKETLSFLTRIDAPFDRQTLEGHITASGWVLNPDLSSVLLIHHAKLDRWFQPGGHIEPEDRTVLVASQREVLEETGLAKISLLIDGIFDIDIHTIPERKGIPEHLHYDIRFCFTTQSEKVEADLAEVKGVKWVPVKSILNLPDSETSLVRMARKSTQL